MRPCEALAIFATERKAKCLSWVDVLLRYFGAGKIDDAPADCSSVEVLGGLDSLVALW